LVTELIVLTPQDQEVPDKLAADQATQIFVIAERAPPHYSSQHASDGGTNVTVAGASAPGPVTVSGARGSAIGNQTASGANAQAQPAEEGWWARRITGSTSRGRS